jgi:hypothetical protein
MPTLLARLSLLKVSPVLGLSDAQEGFWKKEIVVFAVAEAMSRKKRKSGNGNGAMVGRGAAHPRFRL